jgi:lipoate-protein ligase A
MKDAISAVLISSQTNAYYNLAVEKLLLNANLTSPLLFLWQSQNAVVIGAHQNPYAECDLSKMKEDGVQLSRRISGGGAVYHDLGNLNYCFVAPKNLYDEKKQTELIVKALSSLGVFAEISGRNDITVNGFKFSGNAYYRGSKNCLHHGTLLISSDLNLLSRYLAPPSLKLEKRGVESVKSRVTNLSAVNQEITLEAVKNAIINEFCAGNDSKNLLSISEFFTDEQINEQIKLISNNDYLFAKWQKKSQNKAKSFKWGICSIEYNVNNQAGAKEIKINTDCIYPEVIAVIESEYSNNCLGSADFSRFSSIEEYEAYREILELIREEL